MQKNYSEYILGKKHFKLTAITILISLTSIAIFTSIGYALDTKFDLKPILTITAFLLSYPISQYASIKIIKKLIQK